MQFVALFVVTSVVPVPLKHVKHTPASHDKRLEVITMFKTGQELSGT